MRVRADECAGLVVDMQERLFPAMHGGENLLLRILLLIEGLKILEIPVLVTEQYPKGLGVTLNPLSEKLKQYEIVEKISFSCCGEPRFLSALEQLNKKSLIICGIEAHVCVLQTVIDLIERGIRPVVVADCISSRNPEDKVVALDRMRQEGAVITTCESILFELTRVAGTSQFKSISRLVK
ncbi:MAG: hydrolase [Bacteroidetes bacterium]|nr:hydrolase [Bacteroidota bacterium]